MNRRTTLIILSIATTAASTAVYAAAASLEAVGVEIRDSDFPGATFELVHRAAPGYALMAQAEYRDFDITLELAGVVDPQAPAEAQAVSRAFVGIAFRVQAASDEFEKLYLRLGNGRAEDQLQRNHATQFESLPEHPWHRVQICRPWVAERPPSWRSLPPSRAPSSPRPGSARDRFPFARRTTARSEPLGIRIFMGNSGARSNPRSTQEIGQNPNREN